MTPARSPLRRLIAAITANGPYKILSVLIAVALWFIVRDERVETQAIFQLDVQIPQELAITNEALPELTVGVAGTRVALGRLKHEVRVHEIRVKAAEPGLMTLHIRPEDIVVPAGVEVVHVAPSTIALRVEPRVSRRVPVRPRIALEDDATVRVRRAVVAPDLVRIQGPASIVGEVEQVWTEAIPAPHGAETLSQTVALVIPHPQLRLPDVSSVAVSIEFEKIPPPTPVPSASPSPAASPAPSPTPARSPPKKH